MTKLKPLDLCVSKGPGSLQGRLNICYRLSEKELRETAAASLRNNHKCEFCLSCAAVEVMQRKGLEWDE